MAKFQLRLLVLIALGTGAFTSSAIRSDCGLQNPVNVSSEEKSVQVSNSELVYHRATDCADGAANEGFQAFIFDGNCTVYQLTLHFLECQTGDVVVYVLADYLDDEPAVVPLDDAPFKPAPLDRRTYMISSFVETDGDHPVYLRYENINLPEYLQRIHSLVYLENGDILFLTVNLVDVNFCLNDGGYGLRIDVASVAYVYPGDVKYFFEECGNTVEVRDNNRYGLLVYSHAGLGCQYYPTDLPGECTVTFEGENSRLLMAWFGFLFSETASDDGGLIMNLNGTNTDGTFEIQDMYQQHAIARMVRKTTIEVSLQRHPSKSAIGFYLMINL